MDELPGGSIRSSAELDPGPGSGLELSHVRWVNEETGDEGRACVRLSSCVLPGLRGPKVCHSHSHSRSLGYCGRRR